MKRFLFYISAGILVVTAVALIMLNGVGLIKPGTNDLLPQLERFSADASNQISSLRADAQAISANVDQSRSIVSSVANERTPTPGTNAFTSQFVGAVRAADDRREQRLRPVEQQLAVLSQQLEDLRQRATSTEIRFQDSFRDLSAQLTAASQQQGGWSGTIETVVALVGILCSLSTLFLAVRKDSRESRETALRLRELEQKFAQANGM